MQESLDILGLLFWVYYSGFIVPPDRLGFKLSYETEKQAKRARYNFINKTIANKYIAIVLHKITTTPEGRGPTIIDSVFACPSAAHEYVMLKKGICGSKQGRTLFYGILPDDSLYCLFHYNGYEIRMEKLR